MINKHVFFGNNPNYDETVILGIIPSNFKKNNVGLKIGDNCVIRPFTSIYVNTQIGSDFQTGHNVLIRENNVIGNKVSIGSCSTIEPGNKIGNNVRIHSGCFLENVTLGNNVFIAPNVVFTDDPHPICPRYEECVGGAVVEDNVSIGANVTILPGIRIGKNSLIGAGSVVTKDVPENSVFVGNPAKLVKKVDELKCIKGFYERPYIWRNSSK